MDELSEMRNFQELHIPNMDHRSHGSAGGGMTGGKLAHSVETYWFGGGPPGIRWDRGESSQDSSGVVTGLSVNVAAFSSVEWHKCSQYFLFKPLYLLPFALVALFFK